MARRILRPVQVEPHPDGHPARFVWRGQTFTVQSILERWKEAGCWWEGEPARVVFRVLLCDNGGIWELHRFTRPALCLPGDGQPADAATESHWLLYGVED